MLMGYTRDALYHESFSFFDVVVNVDDLALKPVSQSPPSQDWRTDPSDTWRASFVRDSAHHRQSPPIPRLTDGKRRKNAYHITSQYPCMKISYDEFPSIPFYRFFLDN